ncbi:MAG: Rpp14/Pop5 family protein [Candidatus Micrarchaeota archaeon]|nr:Rpp14/Pop5 family protein [Candidatus Micrarchaeota archaeon]
MLKRNRYRYVMAESSVPTDMGSQASSDELLHEISKAIGDISYMEARPRIAYSAGSSFIIKVRRGHESKIVLALALIRRLNGRRCAIYTTKISGTIKKLKDGQSPQPEAKIPSKRAQNTDKD